MTWIKVEDTFPDHPKALGLSDAALACWLRGLCYSSRHLTDGILPKPALRMIGKPAAAAELVVAGLWHEPGHDCSGCEPIADGWVVHEYGNHQRSRAQVEKVRESARERARTSREVRANSRRSSREVTQPESESEQKAEREQNVVSLVVPRERSPQPVDDDDGKFQRVLAAFVEVKISRANGDVRNPAAFRRQCAENARLEHGGELRELLDRFPSAPDDVLVAELLGEPSGLDRGLSWQTT